MFNQKFKIMKPITIAILFFLIIKSAFSFSQNYQAPVVKNEDRIQPWSEDPRYWQYKGEPVLLLGGSKTDHLFLAEGLLEHLDEIKETGANYLRNTMSQREGKELKSHLLLPNGKFDMDSWNPEYWKRFADMLKWTSERDIIVQIEVWDRFDYWHIRDLWKTSPWNPGSNINYTYEMTGLDVEYPFNPNDDKHPLFHTIPGMPLYTPKLDIIRKYQEAFVEKLLSYSLNYGNVLYCMNNETSTPAVWGKYWIDFIKLKAAQKGVTVYTTDMFNDTYKGKDATDTHVIFDDPVHYMFADISQVNSRYFGEDHWDVLTWLIRKINKGKPRPINHTKIYGGSYHPPGTGGFEDGIERFWRNILAGSASSRFHRYPTGNGLNERAKACIKAARLVENDIKLWEVEPHMELLQEREPNEAYLVAKPGEKYALYFTQGGSVGLDLSKYNSSYILKWVSISEGIMVKDIVRPVPDPAGKYIEEIKLKGGSVVTVKAPYRGGWVAVILKE
jgi:hypothetical protein